VVLGRAVEVTDPGEKDGALRAIVEHVVPGRSDEIRGPNPQERAATMVLRLPLDEASAKIRTGGPLDDEDDYALPYWAGEIPLRTVTLPPVADGRLAEGVAPSDVVLRYERPGWRTAQEERR
jgi:hypothetical protein